jgi:hypothetical protein
MIREDALRSRNARNGHGPRLSARITARHRLEEVRLAVELGQKRLG